MDKQQRKEQLIAEMVKMAKKEAIFKDIVKDLSIKKA